MATLAQVQKIRSQARKLHDSGLSLEQIQKEMAKRKIKSGSGKPYTTGGIQYLLTKGPKTKRAATANIGSPKVIDVPVTSASSKVAVVVCDSDNLRSVLEGLL